MKHEMEWDRKQRIEDRKLLKDSRSLIKQAKIELQNMSTAADETLDGLQKVMRPSPRPTAF